MEKKSTGSGYFVAIIVIILIAIAISNSSSNSGGSRSNMSREYNTDSSYRSNVNHVADTFGVSSEEVDRKINAVVDAMNGK